MSSEACAVSSSRSCFACHSTLTHYLHFYGKNVTSSWTKWNIKKTLSLSIKWKLQYTANYGNIHRVLVYYSCLGHFWSRVTRHFSVFYWHHDTFCAMQPSVTLCIGREWLNTLSSRHLFLYFPSLVFSNVSDLLRDIGFSLSLNAGLLTNWCSEYGLRLSCGQTSDY